MNVSNIPAELNSIPEELKELKRWVLCKNQRDSKGKLLKTPWQPSGPVVFSDKPDTWATYEDVTKEWEANPKWYAGVGFEIACGEYQGQKFSGDYLCIDLDHCIDDNGMVKDQFCKWLAVNSYTEKSISGDGIHILVRFPNGRKYINVKKDGVEVWNGGKYVLLTGNISKGKSEIASDVTTLELVESLIRDLQPKDTVAYTKSPEVLGTVDPPELDPAYEKKLGEYYESLPATISGQHGHDKLFANIHNCFRTTGCTNTEMVKAICRIENTRQDTPWSQREIDHKIEDARENEGFNVETRRGWFYGAEKPTGMVKTASGPDSLSSLPADRQIKVSLETLNPKNAKPLDYVWEPYIAKGLLTLMGGSDGTAKSSQTYDWFATITKGGYFPDGTAFNGNRPGRVLIITAEDNTDRLLIPRLTAAGVNSDNIRRLNRKPDGSYVSLQDIPYIKAAAKEWKPDLLVVDPLTAFLAEADIMNPQDMRILLRKLGEDIAEAMNIGVVLIHHNNKMDYKGASLATMFSGSKVLTDACRAIYFVGLESPGLDKEQENFVTIPCKSTIGEKPRTLLCHVERFEYENEGKRIRTSKLVWHPGGSDITEKSYRKLLLASLKMPKDKTEDDIQSQPIAKAILECLEKESRLAAGLYEELEKKVGYNRDKVKRVSTDMVKLGLLMKEEIKADTRSGKAWMWFTPEQYEEYKQEQVAIS